MEVSCGEGRWSSISELMEDNIMDEFSVFWWVLSVSKNYMIIKLFIIIISTVMSYNFKTIKVIPPSSQLINIVLSKTQRKTPTVIHPGYAISRIRSFYMRKIKFCQETINEKLTNILENFPKI